MLRPELVIFDCDGVLVDSEPVTDRVIAANLTRHGLPIRADQVNALFVGGTMQGVFTESRARGARLPDDWVPQIYREMFAALAKGVALMPGLTELLDALDAAGIQKAIASNGPQDKMKVTLTPSGLWSRFAPHIHSAYDDHRPKPNPHMLHKAIAAAGATPDRTVFIDDSPTGAAAGLAAGVKTFALAPNGGTYPPGMTTIKALSELTTYLDLTPSL